MSTLYDDMNPHADWGLIAGTEWRINVTTFESDNVTELDLTGGTVSIRIAPLGDNSNTVINLAGIIDDAALGEWHAILESSDTDGLTGEFTLQLRVVDFGGGVFIPGQGRFAIVSENTL